MKNKMTITELKQYIISEANKLMKVEVLKEEKNIIVGKLEKLNETRLDYFDDLPGGKPSTLSDEESSSLKHWMGVYEEQGVFNLYIEHEYVSRDYEGEYIDTEKDYFNTISASSDIEDIKKFWRRIYELSEQNNDLTKFKFESVSCGIYEEFKTYPELTDAVAKCFYKK